MKIDIALEWFTNPDHLPFIYGVMSKAYEEVGLEVNIIEPTNHYDGFEALKKGEIDIHINEPLHLFEHYFEGIKSLGCFFETNGGVMIRKSSVEKLQQNQKIKITTPAANEVTNKIGFEILNRYAKKNGFTIDFENVEFVQTDFYHIKNMMENPSFDGAWLCFYNFEGIEAKLCEFENLFVDTSLSPYPNFSALELITTEDILKTKGEAITKFIEVTNEMIAIINVDKRRAKEIYYDFTQEEKSILMDKIIEDTIPRFDLYIKPNENRWIELTNFLEELEIVKLSENEYKNIW